MDQTLDGLLLETASPDSTFQAPMKHSTAGEAAVSALAELTERSVAITGTLGSGGMAVVRLGVQESLGREVAIKTLRPDRAASPTRLRLLREAWVTGRLEHPNVVPIHDVHLDEAGTPQIILKRIIGEPWSALLADPSRLPASGRADPLAWHVATLIAVCNATEYAHSQRILHRDIKPENVMIGQFGEVTVLDWGIAVSMVRDPSGQLPHLTPDEPMAGTPSYMAPEMLGGQPLSERTDVYLLGATLHEVLTGHPPHRGSSLEAVLDAVRNTPPPRPEGAPDLLADLSQRAMAADPAQRPATVGDFRAALHRFLSLRAVDHMVKDAAAQLAAIPEDADDIAESLAACRFGFQHALQVWPDHPTARAGLDACLARSVRLALSADDLSLAEHHFAAISAPGAGLREALDAARQAHAEREAEVEALRAASDRSRGILGRTAIAAGIGGLAALIPVGLVEVLGPPGYPLFAGSSLGLLAVIMLAILRWRESLWTGLNRRFVAGLASIPLAQLVVDLGAWLRGWPPDQAHALLLITGLVVSLNVGLTMEPLILLISAAFAALWLASSAGLLDTYIALSLSNMAFVVVIMGMARRDAR